MIREFGMKFECKKCGMLISKAIPVYNKLDIMKAGLKYPDKCRCGSRVWNIVGITGVEDV